MLSYSRCGICDNTAQRPQARHVVAVKCNLALLLPQMLSLLSSCAVVAVAVAVPWTAVVAVNEWLQV